MNTVGNKLWTIVESDTFRECREKHCSDCKLFDDVTKGVTWAISRAPEGFPEVESTGIRIIKSVKYGKNPVYRFFYKILDANRVELLHFEPIPED